MIIYNPADLRYWNYYKILIEDLENCSRYVEFSEENLNTYSVEFARILMSAASEIDVIMKLICEKYEEKGDNINHYCECLKKEEPDLFNEKIFLSRFGFEYKPFENWEVKNSPIWWQAYNNVKHHRSSYFHEANLQNAIEAVGALLIVNLYYLKIVYGESLHNIMSSLPSVSEFMKVDKSYYPVVIGY